MAVSFMYKQGSPQPQQGGPIQNQYKIYNAGVTQQAQDYDTLNKGYSDLFQKAMGQIGNTPQLKLSGQYTPAQYNYQTSPDYTTAFDIQKNLATTGGLSAADQAALRERNIGPIRSIYSSAMMNADRNKILQGGYSPNYAAVQAKLARGLSQDIGDRVTTTNADIARMVQQGKLQASPQLLDAAGHQNDIRNQIGQGNTAAINDAAKFNLQLPLEYGKYNLQANNLPFQNALDALRGSTSLYGTTPALANTYGNQALDSARLGFQVNQANAQNGQIPDSIIRQMMASYGGG